MCWARAGSVCHQHRAHTARAGGPNPGLLGQPWSDFWDRVTRRERDMRPREAHPAEQPHPRPRFGGAGLGARGKASLAEGVSLKKLLFLWFAGAVTQSIAQDVRRVIITQPRSGAGWEQGLRWPGRGAGAAGAVPWVLGAVPWVLGVTRGLGDAASPGALLPQTRLLWPQIVPGSLGSSPCPGTGHAGHPPQLGTLVALLSPR